MKKITLLLFLLFVSYGLKAQINGVIVSNDNNLTLVKIWGTHQERGFAYGSLLGDKINDVFGNYVKPQFGIYYSYARGIIESGQNLKFDSDFVVEAQAIIEGMNQANKNTLNLDYIDLLVCNSILDISMLLSSPAGVACSTLMSWGDATAGTDLAGKSVITRHLDWVTSSTLVDNQVICVSQPSEDDEQTWVSIGFAGMFSVLSGFNEHMGVFQNMMDDFVGNAYYGQQYEPVWFSLRKSLENKDFNQDGSNNTQDLMFALQQNPQGYAGAFLISAMAKSTETVDHLIALIAEIAPTAPALTFRSNGFSDNIPGDNLYTANFQIARNNAKNYCERYNGVVTGIGTGTNISTSSSWDIMRDYSHLSHNLQLMQYAPELDLFRISIFGNNKPAYQNAPVSFNISNLLSKYTGVNDVLDRPSITVYPNPVKDEMIINGLGITQGPVEFTVHDITGKSVFEGLATEVGSSHMIKLSTLSAGLYVLKIKCGEISETKIVIKQ